MASWPLGSTYLRMAAVEVAPGTMTPRAEPLASTEA
jgi:hypothetical protein